MTPSHGHPAQLPKPDAALKGELIDPYVKVETYGIRCDRAKFRTKTVDDNGFNPVWDETFVFDVSCMARWSNGHSSGQAELQASFLIPRSKFRHVVRQLREPDLAMLTVQVGDIDLDAHDSVAR